MTPPPQPQPLFRRPPPPVKEPEWVRRMKEGKHPAKDMTGKKLSCRPAKVYA